MEHPMHDYWITRLKQVGAAFEANNFEVHVTENAEAARDLVAFTLLPAIAPKSISWGGSMSFVATGLFHELKDRPDLEVLNTFDKTLTPEEMMDLRRRSLLTDLFITGTNAVTESGQLVNLDMIGNRVAAIMWGPKNVLLIIGRNKICGDLEEAMIRIKT